LNRSSGLLLQRPIALGLKRVHERCGYAHHSSRTPHAALGGVDDHHRWPIDMVALSLWRAAVKGRQIITG
jgi:hypothetical protein